MRLGEREHGRELGRSRDPRRERDGDGDKRDERDERERDGDGDERDDELGRA